MKYKEKIIEEWTKAGGLINKITAARILDVDQSVITKRKDIKRYVIEGDEFVSFTEIINNQEIKPRKKRKKTLNEQNNNNNNNTDDNINNNIGTGFEKGC